MVQHGHDGLAPQNVELSDRAQGESSLRKKSGRSIPLLARYSLAAAGPVAVAGSQFILSLQLLHHLSPDAFGIVSFLLVASQFSTGISNALLCAPLPVILTEGGAEQNVSLRCVFAVNLGFMAAVLVVFFIVGIGIGETFLGTILFATYASGAVMRWFARAHAYATGTQWRTSTSDVVYSVVLLGGVAITGTIGISSSESAYIVLLASAVLSLIPFGLSFFGEQFRIFGRTDIARYGAIWRQHSKWSLTGVITTEMTANAHAYIVILAKGPPAFAVVAASAILIRPITVVMNALTEFERPRMARALDNGEVPHVFRSIFLFRAVLIITWVGAASAAAFLMVWNPRLLFPGDYDLRELTQGCVLWMIVAGIRLMRTPESAVLQAAGKFRWLAYASIISCGVSVLAVVIFLQASGPIWSVVGILVGETVFAAWIWRETARWRRTVQILPSR
jgi:O-antigen/teichoic acid export membrane protein